MTHCSLSLKAKVALDGYLGVESCIFSIVMIVLIKRVLLGQSRQSRKSNKKFQNIRVIDQSNWQPWVNYSQTVLSNRGSILNKANGIKIGLLLYKLWQIHRHVLIWRTVQSKPVSTILACSITSRKRQATSYEPRHHIWQGYFKGISC